MGRPTDFTGRRLLHINNLACHTEIRSMATRPGQGQSGDCTRHFCVWCGAIFPIIHDVHFWKGTHLGDDFLDTMHITYHTQLNNDTKTFVERVREWHRSIQKSKKKLW